jgi:type II secretory pathway pseudopilin PulG
LIELVLVLVIVSILLAVAVPRFINLLDETVEENRCAAARGAINSALYVSYSSLVLTDPGYEGWLETATIADLSDTMFATGTIPVCPNHGTFNLDHGQVVCSLHGQ